MIRRHFAVGLGETRADQAGDLVRFADIEEALRDAAKYHWLLPTISGSDDEAGDRRNRALSRHFRNGLRGNKLVDAAMRDCPQ